MKFTVNERDNPKGQPAEGSRIRGFARFAVTRVAQCKNEPGMWGVTHLPTGMLLIGLGAKRKVRAAALELLAKHPALDCDDPMGLPKNILEAAAITRQRLAERL